ncbi:MAG: phosphoribosylpyrophosphate synthetase, partial [Candidatus Omnitrophica bacterium]|nr:phosphoribosylpyrophosphate synthetase [Candidatus Omnitrophota bacterium]
KSKQLSKIKVVTIASLLADAIHRIHDEESISCLFDETTR